MSNKTASDYTIDKASDATGGEASNNTAVKFIKPSPPATKSKNSDKPTPMIQQYLDIKRDHQEYLLFYHMGDFYELFFDDAVKAARLLGIALTRRGRYRGEDIPMCGVPIKSASNYLHKLIKGGNKVAICDQIEDPAIAKKQRGGKAVVKRSVTRLVTAGTITDDNLLSPNENNYLLAIIAGKKDNIGLAWIDISTGDFSLASCASSQLPEMISRINPKEIVFPNKLDDNPVYKRLWQQDDFMLTPLEASFFAADTATTRLCEYFNVTTLAGFGDFGVYETAAAAAALSYVERTQIRAKPKLKAPVKNLASIYMTIDPATRNNLELTKGQNGDYKTSLLATISYTLTPQGGRELYDRLSAPLTKVETINNRLDAIDFFANHSKVRKEIRRQLRQTTDIARSLSRISLNRASPRDLGCLRSFLERSPHIADLLAKITKKDTLELSKAQQAITSLPSALRSLFSAALADELPLTIGDTPVIRQGYNKELDQTRNLHNTASEHIKQLQEEYRLSTGIKSLKIRHNNVIGTFIEVNANYGNKLLYGDDNSNGDNNSVNEFSHRQTTANAMRFTSRRLIEFEQRLINANRQAFALETECFNHLCQAAMDTYDKLTAANHGIAILDVASGLAELAVDRNYVRPVVDKSLAFTVENGRHPVIEQALKQVERPFIANNCEIGAGDNQTGGKLWLVTGPNMGGKSTFLRQNSIIAILAQMGCFVPASKAHIGIVDRLFSRVGASDNLAKGQSTFMVEMIETAAIINQSSQNSLVVVDEIGRGTATFDGLSIAWATIEHLHSQNRCRCLFATHFHELTTLANKLKRVENVSLKVKRWQGDIILLHEIVAGISQSSYGLQVAKLAGIPARVIIRAENILNYLKNNQPQLATDALLDELPLFAARIDSNDDSTRDDNSGDIAGNQPEKPIAASKTISPDPHLSPPNSGDELNNIGPGSKVDNELIKELKQIDPDRLTPIKALELIYHLKDIATGGS